MPKNNKRRRYSQRGGRSRTTASGPTSSGTVRVRGKATIDLSYNASFSFNYYSLAPSLLTRLDLYRQMYELYHFNSLRFRGLPFASGGAGPTAMGLLCGSKSTTPSGWNYSYVAALDSAVVLYPGQTVPRALQIPGRRMHNDRKWYATNNGDGYPATFVVGGPNSTAVTAVFEVDYDITFTQPVSDGKQATALGAHTRGDERPQPFQLDDVEIVQMVQETRPPARAPSSGPGLREGQPPVSGPPGIRRQ